MDAADLVAVAVAVVAGVVATPTLLRLIERVPAMATGAYVSEEDGVITPAARDRATRVLAPLLFGLAALRWGASAVVLPFLVCFAALLVVSMIDLEHYRIPDRITFPALAVSSGLIVFVSAVNDIGMVHVRNAAIGAVAYFVLLLVPHLVYPRGMGFGDVKLALLMGLHLGWIYADVIDGIALVMWALILGSGLGVLAGVGFAVARRRRAEFPFGPALAAGCVLAVLLSASFVG